ncbi:MAG: YCF48-related protein [Ignavibacteria bacterium]|nr:YCF48-related protein [Ignavibacteria bacterium]
MKASSILFFIVLTITASSFTYAQPYGWFTQQSGTTNNLNDVKFVNSNTGTIVGQSGLIIRTTNGGTNWISQTSGTPNHLFGVSFANANTGWAVGDIGKILYTSNGGINWISQTSNTNYQLRAVDFLNSNTGYAAGWYGVVLKTTNGGTNWVVLNTGTTSNLNGIFFVNQTSGYVVGWYGTIIKTTNGGTNWTVSASGTSNTLENTKFINDLTGFTIGESGMIKKTTNGGTNWTNQTSSSSSWFAGMTMPLTNYLTVIGAAGTIRTTTNGGVNWLTQASNTSSALNKISYSDTSNGWAVGDYGTIIHTTTSGWLLPPAPALSAPGNNLTCVSLTPNLTWTNIFPPSCYYRVQLSLASTFTANIIDSSMIVFSNLNIPANKLANSTVYYWRVAATNIAGTGPWATTRSFTTVSPTPLAPVLVSPLNNSNGLSLTPLLKWDSVLSASTFRVRISNDSTFTTMLIDSGGLSIPQFQVPAGKLQLGAKYYWRVNASNSCVTSAWSPAWNFRVVLTYTGGNETGIPKHFKLYENYPNPFNPATRIKFDLPDKSIVKLFVYDITGKLVSELVNTELKAGSYDIDWNAENVSSGIYFYRIQTDKFTDVKRMIFLK